jgi:8-oxo-dGTP pyrophosphatase MutT (NUDIX family)
VKEEPKPSATVVVVRDARVGLELLLLQRSPRRDGRPGPWVFPGGKIEPQDTAHPGDEVDIARRAAVRETAEEAGLALPASELVTISRWITPEIAPRRFDTWFFLGAARPDEAVRVDGSEICDHRWLSARDALDAHFADAMTLAPPTFVTVTWLERYARTDEAIAHLGAGPIVTFRPKILRMDSGACILYPGDAGYDSGDMHQPGPRHRLWSLPPEGYRYERED